MSSVPALFGVVLAAIATATANCLKICFYSSGFLSADPPAPPKNIFQNLFHQQKQAKWERPGWKGREAHLCSHLVWSQTAVQLGVALIKSSLLCFIGHFISGSAAQMGSGLKTISHQGCEVFPYIQLLLFGFAFKPFCLLWLFWWPSVFQTYVYQLMTCHLRDNERLSNFQGVIWH